MPKWGFTGASKWPELTRRMISYRKSENLPDQSGTLTPLDYQLPLAGYTSVDIRCARCHKDPLIQNLARDRGNFCRVHLFLLAGFLQISDIKILQTFKVGIKPLSGTDVGSGCEALVL
jgi:hypothetical protein